MSLTLPPFVRSLLLLIGLTGFLIFPVPGIAAEEVETFDRWYVLRLKDQPAGHARMQREVVDGQVITRHEMEMTVRRGGNAVTVEQSSRFVETMAGEPVSARSTESFAGQQVRREVVFEDGQRTLTTRNGQQASSRKLEPIEGEWRSPAEADRYIKAQLKAGADEIEVRTIDLTVGTDPVVLTMDVQGRENVEVMGKTVPAHVWEAEISQMPGVTTREHVDEQGRLVRSETNIGGLRLTMLAAEEALARREVEPPRIMADLLIPLEEPIERPRQTRQAVYELELKDGATAESVELPTSGVQRVSWGNERTARVVVDLARPAGDSQNQPGEAHRAASALLNHEDEQIRELVARALAEADDPETDRAKAAALRDFVRGYITEKDLSVGMATAEEVARTRQGDCTEHAMLLAAMLRAAEIPSRTVSGVVYIDRMLGKESVFGYHMWTQAWLGGEQEAGKRWVDLDAALPGTAHGFDATHLALSTATLSDDQMDNDLVELAAVVGKLEVRVIEARGE